MQTSEAGNRDIAPTVAHCVWLSAPRGIHILPWGGPAAKPAFTVAALGEALGPPGGKTSSKMRASGFTLVELLLVVAIIAVASAGVSFALRDSGQTQLEREAQRLAALFESARARSLTSGVAVRWHTTDSGFVFDGLSAGALPQGWLAPDVGAAVPTSVLLGPEPIIGPQAVRLVSLSQRGRSLTVATDGVRPFTVQSSAVAESP